MSYEPTNWKSGDTVTSAKLNKIEQGIANAGGGGVLVCTADQTGKLDKTWNEINNASFTVLVSEEEGSKFFRLLTYTEIYNGEYDVFFADISDVEQPYVQMYAASSADGYPVISQ